MTTETLIPTTDIFANRCGYSDVHPYEIVRIVSEKCIEVRAMDTGENKTELKFHVGGFSAHCSNQHAQDYDYTSNPDNAVIKIRLNRTGTHHDGTPILTWKSKHGERFAIADAPHKFHDFNF